MPETAVVCALCGAQSVVATARPDLSSAGPGDFDTRPGEPLRSSIGKWVQQCPACGYCSEDIGRAAEAALDIVNSEAYRALLGDAAMPRSARKFNCFAFLLERLHQHADAGWSALHAAWVCDDANDGDAARLCRARAVELWRTGKAAGQQFADDLATEFALVTDVYRRLGAFEHAAAACAEGLDLEDIPPAIEALLRRQTVLIQRRDTSAHSMEELFRPAEAPGATE